MGKTFVGIGFGPIQSGLFLLEAQASGNFERLVIAEVAPEIVAAVRQSGGRARVNVAHKTDIRTEEIVGLEIYNPLDAVDVRRLVDAIAAADEIAIALPSVDEESGGALCRRHAGVDPLFTRTGWAEYVHDLMERMVNPLLRDRVARVIRDPQRKLAWDDRLVGTMRLAIDSEIAPHRFALGAAAAVELLLEEQRQHAITSLLEELWGADTDFSHQRRAIIDHIQQARTRL